MRVYGDELGRRARGEASRSTAGPCEVAEGATLLDAIHAAGADVPDPLLGRAAVALRRLPGLPGRARRRDARPRPAHPGRARAMRCRTDDPARADAARGALELIVSELPERALELPPERSELVRACARARGRAHRGFSGERGPSGRDDSHPYVKLDRDLCIACGRCVRMCDEVQGTFALALVGRGFGTVVAPGTGGDWRESDCVACGGCVDSCPTGALSEPGFLDLRPIERDGHDHLRLLRRRLHARRPRSRRRGRRDHPDPRRPGQPRPRLRQGPLRARLRRARPTASPRPLDPARRRAATRRAGTRRSASSAASCAASATSTGPTRRGDLLGARDQRGELPDAEADAGRRSAPTTSTTARASATRRRPRG